MCFDSNFTKIVLIQLIDAYIYICIIHPQPQEDDIDGLV